MGRGRGEPEALEMLEKHDAILDPGPLWGLQPSTGTPHPGTKFLPRPSAHSGVHLGGRNRLAQCWKDKTVLKAASPP